MSAVTIRARLPMPQDAHSLVSPEHWSVLTDAIFPSAKTSEAIVLALRYCRARKLDVFKRPVSIVPMWNSSLRREVETVWPGINETQVTASRAGWAGMDEPKWGPEITRKFEGMTGKRGEEKHVEFTLTFPEWCAVTVYRMVEGQRCAFSEPVYWLETYATTGRTAVPSDMWRKRPRGQLHKCAKAASLRAAFPESGNDYTDDEMSGREIESGGVVIEGSATEVQSDGIGNGNGSLRSYASEVARGHTGQENADPSSKPPVDMDKLRDRVDAAIQSFALVQNIELLEKLERRSQPLIQDVEESGSAELIALLKREMQHHRKRITDKATAPSLDDALPDLGAP